MEEGVSCFLMSTPRRLWILQNHSGKDVQEEALANVMTNGLMAVFVDNPWLLPWMQKEIKSDSD